MSDKPARNGNDDEDGGKYDGPVRTAGDGRFVWTVNDIEVSGDVKEPDDEDAKKIARLLSGDHA